MAFPDNLESLQKKIIQKYFFFDEISLPTFWVPVWVGHLQSMTQLRAKEGKYFWSDLHPRKPDFGSPEFEISKLAQINVPTLGSDFSVTKIYFLMMFFSK